MTTTHTHEKERMNNSKLCVFCVLGHSVVVVHDSCGTFRDWDMNSDVAMLDTFLVASNIKKRSSRESKNPSAAPLPCVVSQIYRNPWMR
jgi:hypothetical protein